MNSRTSLVFTLTMGLCLAVLSDAKAATLSSVAKRLAKGVDKLPTRRIAVLPFGYQNGMTSSGSSLVAERLTTMLVENGRVEVVERALLDKAMGEIKLGMTGMMDPATTQRLGKVLGVPAIVTGTLNDTDEETTEVNARLIQTETGSILAASAATIRRTWRDMPQPPKPAHAAADERDDSSTLHMSKLITNSSPRRHAAPPIYGGAIVASPPAPALSNGDDVLTLNNDDLIPLQRGRDTDPDAIVGQLMRESGPPPDTDLRLARRIYHRNPDPRLRGRALMAMGHLLERSGRPQQAAQAYHQVLTEFPEAPALQTDAQQRLARLHDVQ